MAETPTPTWPQPPGTPTPTEFDKARYQAELDAVLERFKDALSAHAASIAEENTRARDTLIHTRALELADHEAQIAADAAEAAANVAKETVDRAFYNGVMTHIYTSYVEAAKAGIDRAKARGELVQTAAAAVATLYTAVLALSYAADAQRLPIRGVIPAIFLGLAIVLSIAYVSFVTKPGEADTFEGQGNLRGALDQQRNLFILWCRDIELRRRGLLQLSVIALAGGVVFLPLPFLDMSNGAAWRAAGIGAAAVLVIWAVWYLQVERGSTDS